MRKYAYIIVLILIAGTVLFTSCKRMEEVISPVMPDAEKIEPPPEMMPTDEAGIGIFNTTVMPGHGLLAEAFHPGGVISKIPDFETLTPFHTWMVANIDVPQTSYERGFPGLGLDVLEYFGIRLRGQLKIETAGTYNFKIQSDDGAQLYINGELIIDNDGLQPFTSESASAMLAAGYHDIEIRYFQGPRNQIGLQWSWQPPEGVEAIVPPEVLYPPGTGEISVEPMVETPVETTPETMIETPAETTPETMVDMEPAETTDLTGGMVDIADAMSTIGIRKVYWISEIGEILRSNPDGSDLETVVPSDRFTAYRASDVTNLVVDSEGGKLYWNVPGEGLWCVNLDGTNIEQFVTTPVPNFTLDLEARKIYWIAGVENEWTLDTEHLFQRSNLDGSGVEKFKTSAVQALLGDLRSIAFDPINRKIYASNDGKNTFVINADDLDIKFADIEFQWPSFSYLHNLAFDIDDRKIYWIYTFDGVHRANFGEPNIERVRPNGHLPAATVDFSTRKFYWVDSSLNRHILWQANLDGSDTAEGLFAVGNDVARIAVETGPIN